MRGVGACVIVLAALATTAEVVSGLLLLPGLAPAIVSAQSADQRVHSASVHQDSSSRAERSEEASTSFDPWWNAVEIVGAVVVVLVAAVLAHAIGLPTIRS